MADFTPTTDEVRGAWVAVRCTRDEEIPGQVDEFDRWLAEHDREVREALLVELTERHLADVQYPNEYRIRAVPQAALLDLIKRERKVRG